MFPLLRSQSSGSNSMETSTESIQVIASPTEGGHTLRSIVEIIRGIMQADVVSIFGFSLDDERFSWKAAAGFRSAEIDYEETSGVPALRVSFSRRWRKMKPSFLKARDQLRPCRST